MKLRFVYGPVPSQRLGRSLGVNPIPFKYCSYSCIYCQLGRTVRLTATRGDYLPPHEIIEELEHVLSHSKGIDYITFVGEGEPTLCRSLGDLINRTKSISDLPVAVITNGSLLSRGDVRKELARADLVLPSLDAVTPATFERINRPHGKLRVQDIVAGLEQFRESFNGKLWIEIMLVAGVNDGEESLVAVRKSLDRIHPDQVHVSIPIRPPAERQVRPPAPRDIARARAILGSRAQTDLASPREFGTTGSSDPLEAVEMILRRHPMREDEILTALAECRPHDIRPALVRLAESGRIQSVEYGGITYYTAGEGRYERDVPASVVRSPHPGDDHGDRPNP